MNLTDRLVGVALASALRDAWTCDQTASVLARIADGNASALRRALAQVRRALSARPSPVGERAESSLLTALALVPAGRGAQSRRPRNGVGHRTVVAPVLPMG